MSISDTIDELELAMQEYPTVDCPVTHGFTNGFYIRTIFMPAVGEGTLITSLIHNTTHSFFVSEGSVKVKVNDEEWQVIEAPYWGITHPGTRRVLLVTDDCTWTTFHPISEKELPEDYTEEKINESVERITERIIERHENKLLGGVIRNNKIINYIKR
jgi:hypothetical protein